MRYNYIIYVLALLSCAGEHRDTSERSEKDDFDTSFVLSRKVAPVERIKGLHYTYIDTTTILDIFTKAASLKFKFDSNHIKLYEGIPEIEQSDIRLMFGAKSNERINKFKIKRLPGNDWLVEKRRDGNVGDLDYQVFFYDAGGYWIGFARYNNPVAGNKLELANGFLYMRNGEIPIFISIHDTGITKEGFNFNAVSTIFFLDWKLYPYKSITLHNRHFFLQTTQLYYVNSSKLFGATISVNSRVEDTRLVRDPKVSLVSSMNINDLLWIDTHVLFFTINNTWYVLDDRLRSSPLWCLNSFPRYGSVRYR